MFLPSGIHFELRRFALVILLASGLSCFGTWKAKDDFASALPAQQ
jgi:hypothetical protein